MDIEKLIETLRQHGVSCVRAYGKYCSICDEAATALSTLQAENEKLRAELKSKVDLVFQQAKELDRRHLLLQEQEAELEREKRERDALIEDFVDYVTGGVPNPAIFCKNRCSKCVDMRGWCTGKNCNGFYPSGASG